MSVINIRHLRAFVALAERQHFTKAAEAIHLSQPALTALIQQLEADLGVKLIRRTTRNVELTDIGQEFLGRARKVIADFSETLEHVADYRALAKGRIKLAALPSLCASVLPGLLRSFHDQHPLITLSVQDVAGERVMEALRTHAAELAFSYAENAKDLIAQPVLRDRLVLVCAPALAPTSAAIARWCDLAGKPVIAMARGTTIRTLTEGAAAAAGVALDYVLEPELMPSAIAFARAGLGIAVLPSSVAPARGESDLIALPLSAPEIERTISLFHLRQYPLSPAAAALSRHILQHAAGLQLRQ